jgi:hypothetical protein
MEQKKRDKGNYSATKAQGHKEEITMNFNAPSSNAHEAHYE